MQYSDRFQPELVKVKGTTSSEVVVHSSGEVLRLSVNSAAYPIYSVLDIQGAVVKSMHQWLRLLRTQAGLSISMSTVDQYARTLSYLARWIEREGPYPNLTIDENLVFLSRQDIHAWLSYMEERGAESHNTLHSREACVKQFLDWMTTKEAGKLRDPENSPYGRGGTLPYVVATPNARSPKYISTEIVIELLRALYNECERCMFQAQYDMGLRISELVNLIASDFPDESMYDPSFAFIPICVRRVKGRGGQKREKITLISRAVLKRIKRYHSSREYKLAPDWDINDPEKPAFLTVNQLRWSSRNASKQFKKAVRRARLVDAMSTHWMRHGTAYSVLRSDIGKTYVDRMLIVQQMLGHARLKTTEIYTQISPDLLQKLTKKGKEMDRLDEAERIREHTFLAPLQHSEKRGHHA